MSVSPSSVSSPPPALSAFLRGIERRGAVLAELQAGDAVVGDAALAEAMRAFRAQAESAPMAQWPQQFWGSLLGQPGLRTRTAVALPIDVTDRLGELASGARAALLLRVAAGLSEAEAAAVLGVPEASFRTALQNALPRHPDGRADPAAWERLREQIHRRIKTLPPDRLVRLTRVREGVLRNATGSLPAQSAIGAVSPPRPRWLMPVLWGLLALCALALVATFLPWGSSHPGLSGIHRVRVEPLGEADEAASRYDAQTALVAHRDFALLADPSGEAAAQDLEFRSWLAAQEAAGNTVPAPPQLSTEPDAPAPTALPDTAGETEGETADAP